MNKNEFNPNHPPITPQPVSSKEQTPQKSISDLEEVMKLFKLRAEMEERNKLNE